MAINIGASFIWGSFADLFFNDADMNRAPDMQLLAHANMLVHQGQANVINMHGLLIQILNRRRRRRRRRPANRVAWVKPWVEERPRFGLYENLLLDVEVTDLPVFKNFTRFEPDLFNEILVRITPRIQRTRNNYRLPGSRGAELNPGLMLAVTMRYLATGTSYSDLQYGFRMCKSSISEVVREVCQAIQNEYWDETIQLPATPDEWLAVAEGFKTRWNFHHTLGALDGKHVALIKPRGAISEYYNYKKFHSIILMALVDANYQFLWLNIGTEGAAGDAQIWNGCDLKRRLSNNTMNLPPPEPLPGDVTDIPYFIIGDDAFALEEYMQKPYSQRALSREERIFNYRLSRARRVVENAFGVLAMRFRVLTTTMRQSPEVVNLIVTVCCILHNIIRERYPNINIQLYDIEDQNHNAIPGAWRAGIQMHDINRNIGGNTGKKRAKAQRDLLKLYYNSPAGSVPWQEDMI